MSAGTFLLAVLFKSGENAGKTLRCGESTFEVVGIKGGQSEFR